MPIPIDARRKPASVKVHVSSGAGVDITWADGHASHYDFAYLREECPCAMCNDERMKKAQGQEKDEQLKKENTSHAARPGAQFAAASHVQAKTHREGRARRRQLRPAD